LSASAGFIFYTQISPHADVTLLFNFGAAGANYHTIGGFDIHML